MENVIHVWWNELQGLLIFVEKSCRGNKLKFAVRLPIQFGFKVVITE